MYHSHYKPASQRIKELELELLETQKDLSFYRKLYALQDQLVDQLRKDLIEARAEAKKWKDNHDNQVNTNQLLRDRPDLCDRAKSVDALIKQRDTLVSALSFYAAHMKLGYDITDSGQVAKEALAAVKSQPAKS
jgi:hypothetical protein